MVNLLDIIWKRIKNLEGETFRTIQNLEFTYEISGDVLIPSRTEYNLSKSDVGKILERIPLKGPGEISNDVRGPSYLWAILHDSRISNDEW
tara:strand:+ start:757 stop:1029 length:273 start_codon:yes stop_codon:yes gene_type:complete